MRDSWSRLGLVENSKSQTDSLDSNSEEGGNIDQSISESEGEPHINHQLIGTARFHCCKIVCVICLSSLVKGISRTIPNYGFTFGLLQSQGWIDRMHFIMVEYTQYTYLWPGRQRLTCKHLQRIAGSSNENECSL